MARKQLRALNEPETELPIVDVTLRPPALSRALRWNNSDGADATSLSPRFTLLPGTASIGFGLKPPPDRLERESGVVLIEIDGTKSGSDLQQWVEKRIDDARAVTGRRGKAIILIGTSAPQYGDMHKTPFGELPGVYILADTVRGLLADDLRPSSAVMVDRGWRLFGMAGGLALAAGAVFACVLLIGLVLLARSRASFSLVQGLAGALSAVLVLVAAAGLAIHGFQQTGVAGTTGVLVAAGVMVFERIAALFGFANAVTTALSTRLAAITSAARPLRPQ
jgi:hypothetical protein